MKKIILTSLILGTVLFASSTKVAIPLSASVLSV